MGLVKLPLRLRPILHLPRLNPPTATLKELPLVLRHCLEVPSSGYLGNDDYRFIPGLLTVDSGKRLVYAFHNCEPPNLTRSFILLAGICEMAQSR
jgi:hypothetical protein